MSSTDPVFKARGLVKRFGHVTALSGADFDLYPGEVLAVIGDNGAGKSTLIKVLSGAFQPDEGEIHLDGEQVHFRSPLEARRAGIETVYQDLAVAPALDIASNLFLGREQRRRGPARAGVPDARQARDAARGDGRPVRAADRHPVGASGRRESLGRPAAGRRGRARAAWGRRLVIMDEPTAALGVKETAQVVELIKRVRERGLSVILISHDMPHVFELADRIHIMRLGKRAAVVTPQSHSMPEAVAIMTGAAVAEPRLEDEAPR